jgi:HK97 family phage major capsid protein
MQSSTRIPLPAVIGWGLTLALAAVGVLAFFDQPAALAVWHALMDPTTAGGLLAAEGAAAIDPAKIKEALDKVSDSVKEEGQRLLKMVEKEGTQRAELKATVDTLLTKQGELRTELDEALKKLAKNEKAEKEPDMDTLEGAINEKSWKEFTDQFLDGKHAQKSGTFKISRKALMNTGATGAALNFPGTQVLGEPLRPLQRRLTVRDLLAPGSTDGAVIWYPRETGYTNNAAPVSEGSLKPKSEITFETITENVRTIAHMLDISLQMLTDVKFIRSYVGTRLLDGLKLVEENQLLNGSGTGQNLSGIYTEATAYSPPSGATVNGAPPGGSSEQDIDKLRLALLQVELAFAYASGIVLHPTSWAGIELLKDSTGQYLFVNVREGTTPRLWGRTVVATPAMNVANFLVGDFAAHAQIFDREDANLQISFENKDNFERNMATLREEERLALAIYRPEAFVKGTLESQS